MYQPDRRITQPVPHDLRYCSTWPCQSQKATGEPGSAVAAESFTIRRTPAAAAASMAAVSQPTRRGSSAQDSSSASAPSNAARTDPRSAKSPTASSTFSPSFCRAFPGSRAKARTRPPRAVSARTTSDPAFPIAPVTTIMFVPSRT
jgi:hypothetical protein